MRPTKQSPRSTTKPASPAHVKPHLKRHPHRSPREEGPPPLELVGPTRNDVGKIS